MSDGIDPSTQVRRTRTDDSNSSNGNLSIVLAVVAVVVGFLILRSVNSGGSTTVAVGAETTTTTLLLTDTTVATTVPPAPTVNFAGATILVVNSNGKSGTAAKTADQLKAIGAQVTPKAGNAAAPADVTQILYNEANPAALTVAQSVTLVLPGAPAPTPLVGEPAITTDRQGADVILMLGKDLADTPVALPPQPATTVAVVPASLPATPAPSN